MMAESQELLKMEAEKFGLKISDYALNQFSSYLDLIQNWNKKINLTAIRREKEIVLKHFVDSLSIYPWIKPKEIVMDLGAGLGCPGIPLKIVEPSLELILLEARGKKAFFLNMVINKLKLEETRVIKERAESKSLKRFFNQVADVVVARAFGSFELICRLSYPYLKPQGKVIAMKGPKAVAEFQTVKERLNKLGFELGELKEFKLGSTDISRSVVILTKKL